MDYPEILHHGITGGVTGSCYQALVDTRHSRLIDCGLFQGAATSAEGKAGANSLAIEFSLAGIKALIATHVHIDHVGRIPYLLAAGFKGAVLCSEPSAKLLPIVLEDAFKLGFSRDQKQVERYLKLIQQRIIASVSRLAQTAQPAIVIAANGMCSSGRIVNYLKAMLHNPRHDVLFVGYQARGTPGRAIQVYGPSEGYVELDGERYKVAAKITTIGGYSAHVDQKELLGFVTRMRHWSSDIRIGMAMPPPRSRSPSASRRIMTRRAVNCGAVSPRGDSLASFARIPINATDTGSVICRRMTARRSIPCCVYR